MATITARKNAEGIVTSWQAKVRIKGRAAETKSFPTKESAKDWARRVEVELKTGSYISANRAEKTLFSDLAKDFESDFAPHHYRGGAWKHKLAHLRERLDDLSILAITPQVVASYRDERLKDPDPRYKDPSKAPRVGAATVKSELDLLSKVLDVCSKEFGIGLPAGNPVKHIRKPKNGKSRDRRLSEEEWAQLVSECRASRNPWLWPAVQISVETAMRQGELLSLTWEDVVITRKYIMLRDPDKIKNAEPRAVPLSSRAIAVLEGLPQDIKGMVIPLPRMTLYTAFERACGRAQIDNFTWHDLRHEGLSRLAERGDFSVLEIAAVSGHKTLNMLKRYTHLRAETLAKKLG